METPSLTDEGYAIAPGVLEEAQVAAVDEELNALAVSTAGTRALLAHRWCADMARALKSHPLLAPWLMHGAVAIQCSLFEKSSERNWLVPLHQDLSIPVHERCNDPRLSGWSQKEGTWYVQPPIDLLEELLAVRLHIDPCDADNGALRVVPRSHRHGRLSEEATAALRRTHIEQSVPLNRGDALMMRPLLLHASSKATRPNRRRVLHFLFASPTPRYGLRWGYAV